MKQELRTKRHQMQNDRVFCCSITVQHKYGDRYTESKLCPAESFIYE